MLVGILIALFLLGLIFGSFSSVLLHRLGDGVDAKQLKSVLVGRSECPHCKKTLQPKHLIPVISYLIQKGKCAFCQKEIAAKYPILEIGSAIIFVASYMLAQYVLGIESIGGTVFWIALNYLLWLLIAFDIEKLELHVPIRFLALLLVLVPQFFQGFGSYKWAFRGSILFGGFFYALYFFARRYVRMRYKRKQDGMGEGDAMMAFLIGAALPIVLGVNHVQVERMTLVQMLLLFLILSSVIGLLLTTIKSAFFGIKKTKIGAKQTIVMPFIPAMIVAFWILVLWSDKIILLVFPPLG